MDSLETIAQRMMQKIHRGEISVTSTTQKIEYECEICKDEEWIIDQDTNSARPCRCREAKLYKRIIESCGITEAFLQKTFDNYEVLSEPTRRMLITARKYVENFDLIRDTKNNSLGLLGQVGSGKTHLTIAVANELMKKNIGVRYMQYREDLPRIKQVVTSEIDYNREMSKYKNAAVLLIDDLYKNAIGKGPYGEYLNEADKRIMFEIINHRYIKQLPIIISSECSAMQILDLDEGIGSRMIEMTKGHIAEISGKEHNYRLRR
ncbi:ATP-binding protein [Gudongella sp. SC589]|uniref:ATP-binding protein n=1 Tax=Gudongella sp. SC589 TaxID=3385990 RepID=UPI003904AD7E